ncbi:MAG TPA: hypothetical protein VFB59_04620 [Candidatus Saccharimonadales bacterium]|nr:hypothetical protein [Candidatus Saccharimonadales bacterium]
MTTFAQGFTPTVELDGLTSPVSSARPLGIYPVETNPDITSAPQDAEVIQLPTRSNLGDTDTKQTLPAWGDLVDFGRPIEAPASKRGRAVLNALKIGVVAYEAMPGLDDATRYGLLVGSQLAGVNPIVAAAVVGLSTFAVEGAAVLASAKWIAEDRIGLALEAARAKIDTFKEKLNTSWPRLRLGKYVPNVPQEQKMQGESLSLPIKAGIVLYAGSVALLAAMQRRDPSRTAEQNRKDGLTSAATLAGTLALEGAAIGFGLANFMNPVVLAAAGASVLGIRYGARKLRQKAKTRTTTSAEPVVLEQGDSTREAFRPQYDLDQAELDAHEKGLVNDVKEVYPEEGVYVALIDPDHPYSNFVRGHEEKRLPGSAEFPEEAEKRTIMFALVDTRPNANRVVHVGTISGPNLSKTGDSGQTGFVFVDELCRREGNFTPEEFQQHYEGKLDLSKCIAVESNVQVGEKVEKYRGFNTVDLAYRTLFSFVDSDRTAVFASINELQARSFQLRGIGVEPLMGRKDLSTPEADKGKVSNPVVIYNTAYTRELFGMMGPELPIVTFDA